MAERGSSRSTRRRARHHVAVTRWRTTGRAGASSCSEGRPVRRATAIRGHTTARDGRGSTRAPCFTDRTRNASLIFDSRKRRMLLAEGPAVADETARRLRLWEWKDDAWVLIDSLGPRRIGFSGAV